MLRYDLRLAAFGFFAAYAHQWPEPSALPIWTSARPQNDLGTPHRATMKFGKSMDALPYEVRLFVG